MDGGGLQLATLSMSRLAPQIQPLRIGGNRQAPGRVAQLGLIGLSAAVSYELSSEPHTLL